LNESDTVPIGHNKKRDLWLFYSTWVFNFYVKRGPPIRGWSSLRCVCVCVCVRACVRVRKNGNYKEVSQGIALNLCLTNSYNHRSHFLLCLIDTVSDSFNLVSDLFCTQLGRSHSCLSWKDADLWPCLFFYCTCSSRIWWLFRHLFAISMFARSRLMHVLCLAFFYNFHTQCRERENRCKLVMGDVIKNNRLLNNRLFR